MHVVSDILTPDPILGEALPMAAKPLDEYRLERYMTVTEFCKFLGISPGTYYKVIRLEPGDHVNFSTMKRIARQLKLKSPGEIAEFTRKPSGEDAPGGES